MRNYYAHSLEGKDPDEWEPLEDHLQAVARRASIFADKFGAANWGNLAGLWHDIGKYSLEFQAYLFHENGLEAHLEQYQGRVDHSTAGAQIANRIFSKNKRAVAGRILAYCIAGHHAGLADLDAAPGTGTRGLNQRLADATIKDYSAHPSHFLDIRELGVPPVTLSHRNSKRGAFQFSLFCRMLFSCLVDADFLATEAYMSPEKSQHRPKEFPSLDRMEKILESNLDDLRTSADRNAVYENRQQILANCLDAAEYKPGLFSLTVPTGGGKTLSSLAFALKHARLHQLDRVIYAIPFTSIIEQTADVFRKIFNPLSEEIVLEHHSNLDPDCKNETSTSRLAIQNWDAPLVVTTNVQFFESLFASQTSRCRKLHRITNSVIILDEAQTLPVELLEPCLAVLRELAADYGCTIVLCTATQPAIEQRDDFKIGLENVREIIPESVTLYRKMKRVEVKQLGKLADTELVERLIENEQFLCIVNTKKHARDIYELLKPALPKDRGEELFHLSTFMCGEHRSQVIKTIHNRLEDKKPCRVVSTQLIEAGVDVDFPVVYRALTGIDSIAQAAGRCNREGKRESAAVFVFEPSDGKLFGYLRSTADSTKEMRSDFDDLLDLEAIQRYFELHYWKHDDWDKEHIMQMFQCPEKPVFQFRTASEKFRMIKDATIPVFIPYEEKGIKLIEQLRSDAKDMQPRELNKLLRKLQRYSVSIYENIYRQMLGGDIQLLHEVYPILLNDSIYDKKLGLRIDRAGYHEPDSLIG